MENSTTMTISTPMWSTLPTAGLDRVLVCAGRVGFAIQTSALDATVIDHAGFDADNRTPGRHAWSPPRC